MSGASSSSSSRGGKDSTLPSLADGLAGAPDGLADVIGAIADAGRKIAHMVRRARIEDVVGALDNTNVQGEVQQKLDVIANDELIARLSACPSVAVCASEEEEEALVIRTASQGGRYAVLFDPLDGSSNIDVAVGIGTIFSVLPNDEPDATTKDCVLQPGSRQSAAGYVLFGSQVALVLTMGDGVDMYVLDPESDTFVRVLEGIRMPDEKKIYSINEAYVDAFPGGVRNYLAACHADGYTGRYIGSMVADVHRTLIKGGVFLYPETTTHPAGKLRLMYEANPMAFLIEQAGGAAATGAGRILDVEAEKVHQRTPVVLGSTVEVERALAHLAQ